jgi:hypothetical protein
MNHIEAHALALAKAEEVAREHGGVVHVSSTEHDGSAFWALATPPTPEQIEERDFHSNGICVWVPTASTNPEVGEVYVVVETASDGGIVVWTNSKTPFEARF